MRLMGREPQTESHTPPSLLSSVLPPFLPPSLADIHLNAFPPPEPITAPLAFGPSFCILEEASPLLQSDWLTAMRREARRVCQPIFSLGIKIDLLNFFFFSFCTVEWNGWGGKMSPGLYFDLYVNEPRKRNWIFTLSHRIFFFHTHTDGDSRFVGWWVHQACLLWFLFNTSRLASFLIHVLLWRKTKSVKAPTKNQTKAWPLTKKKKMLRDAISVQMPFVEGPWRSAKWYLV